MTTHSNTGAHWQRLRRDPMQAPVWLALAHCYAAHGLPWQAGYTARQALRLDASLGIALEQLPPGILDDTAGDAQLGRAALPGAGQLIRQCVDAAAEDPGDWLSWLYLARMQDIAPATGCLPTHLQALDTQQRAVALEPIAGESLHRPGYACQLETIPGSLLARMTLPST